MIQNAMSNSYKWHIKFVLETLLFNYKTYELQCTRKRVFILYFLMIPK